MRLFVDTWGWVTLCNRKEPYHEQVQAFYLAARQQRLFVSTTDYVLDETFTLLFRRLPFPQAVRALTIVDRAIRESYLNLEWITSQRFERAKELRLQLHDKPHISFTDLTSMVVMAELSIDSVLTDDAHFLQVGAGFQLVPRLSRPEGTQ